MNNAIKFKDLPDHSLFTIAAEAKGFYASGRKIFGMIRSHDRTVYKKRGPGYSTSKNGKTIILDREDLVFPFISKKPH